MKGPNLSATAAQMAAPDTQAYVIMTIDSKAQVQLSVEGDMMPVVFMKEQLQLFINQVMAQKLQFPQNK